MKVGIGVYQLMHVKIGGNNVDHAMFSLGWYYSDNLHNYETCKNYIKMNKYFSMAIKLENERALEQLCNYHENYMQHYLLRQINSKIAIEKIEELEENNFLGSKIFKELTEYCFNPQRLLRFCNIYDIELNEYMDII